MKITLDKVVAGAEGSLGGRDPGLSGIPAFEGCSLVFTQCCDDPHKIEIISGPIYVGLLLALGGYYRDCENSHKIRRNTELD